MAQQKESKTKLLKKLIKEQHPDAWLIDNASIGTEKVDFDEYGAFTKEALTTYKLSNDKKLKKTGELYWPTGESGEVDHFFLKSVFNLNGKRFVTVNQGKRVQEFLEKEKQNALTVLPRPFHRKIFGFRSGKRWRQIVASFGYLCILLFIIHLIVGDDSASEPKKSAHNESVQATSVKKEAPAAEVTDKKEDKTQRDNQTKQDSKANDKKDNQSKTNNSQGKKQGTSVANQIPVSLIETVDGDTIKVNYKGREETVRYLLVDTPESKKPGMCVQPYAESAYLRNKQLVNSGKLTLEFDGNQRDKYDRLLAYVFVNGKSVQEQLLKEGYARVAYVYDPPYKYLSRFEKDEEYAKQKRLNIWSKSGYVTDHGFNGCSIGSVAKKSNSSSSHSSSSTSTTSSGSSTGTEYFANCTELRKKYPHGVPSTHPAYQPRLDRDHDNFACETN